MNEGAVAAVDLGASSGRVIVGRVTDGRVSLEEVHRFPNEPVQLDDGLYWDALRLHHEILTGLRRAARVAPDLRSIGIDTWGVDVGMLDEAGALVGNPVHHRDPRNLPAVERVHARIPQADLYARTGLQFMPINTIYQLEAARVTPAFAIVRRVLPLPDLLGYWLTGVVVAERTHASTTGLLDPRTGDWDDELVARLGLDPRGAAAPRRPRDRPGTGAAVRAGGDRPARRVRRHARRVARHGLGGRGRAGHLGGRGLHLVGHVVARRRRDGRADPQRGEPRRRTSPTRAAWTGRSGSCAT